MLDYIIASDLHLGTKHSKAKEFIQFLENNPTKTLILNGDIVDGWALSRGSKWKKSHTNTLSKILKISNKTEVIWIRGNHDDFLADFIGMKFGNIKIKENHIIKVANKKYFIFHGDVIDIFITQYKWLAKIGSIGYDFALFVNHWYNKYRNWRNLPYYSISQRIKNGVKTATNYVNDFEETATKLANQNKCDGVICGHIHQPANRKINGKAYINSGDWVENMSAICIDNNGKIYLYENQ